MKLKKDESLVYSNDFTEDALEDAEYAIQSPQTLSNMLTQEDGDLDRLTGFFETIGMPEQQAYDFTNHLIEERNDESSAQEIFDQFEKLAPDAAAKKKAIHFIADQLIQTGYYDGLYDDRLEQQIEENCDALGISATDDILILGPDEANPQVLSPSKNMADEILDSLPYADPVLTITHEGKAPCLKASISSPDTKDFSYSVIPSDWAEDAYLSKKFHDKLNKLMLENDDVKDFLYDAEAIPEVRKDPVSAAILHGAIELMREKNPYACKDFAPGDCKPAIEHVAQKLQNFDKKAFDDWLDERLDEHPSFTEMPYDASRSLELDIPKYIESLPATKATAVSRGLTNIFNAKDYDKIQKAVSGIVYGEKKTIQNIKAAGHVAER